jgi:hypothetical protein
MTVEQAAEIWARELRRARTFSAKELGEARQGRTVEELADLYEQSRRETWEEVRAAAAQADGEVDSREAGCITPAWAQKLPSAAILLPLYAKYMVCGFSVGPL